MTKANKKEQTSVAGRILDERENAADDAVQNGLEETHNQVNDNYEEGTADQLADDTEK